MITTEYEVNKKVISIITETIMKRCKQKNIY